jgi:hypothetical protein
VKTGSFFTTLGQPGRVSIARYAPKIATDVPAYPALAPGSWFNKVDRFEYERLFDAQLRALDAREVWNDLHRLAGDSEPLLLCWEHSESTWRGCHRRIVSAWFLATRGERVPEWDHDE